MTDRQIEIGDSLLKHLLGKGGASNKDQYPVALEFQGIDIYIELPGAVSALEDLGLVEASEGGYRTRLKPEGYEAAKMGIAAYLREKKEVAELDKRSKEEGIKNPRRANWIGVASMVIALLALFKDGIPWLPLKQEGSKGNDQGETRQDGRGPVEPGLLQVEPGGPVDPAQALELVQIPGQAENIAEILKHDTAFIRELTKEMKKEQGSKPSKP